MKRSGLADSPFFQPAVESHDILRPDLVTNNNDSIAIRGMNEAPLPDINNVNNSNQIQDKKRTNVLSDVRTDEHTNVLTIVRVVKKSKRQKIRHAFDIYQDQLVSLQMRQLEAVQKGKRKPKLGKMVQDAIDQYLQKKQNKGLSTG